MVSVRLLIVFVLAGGLATGSIFAVRGHSDDEIAKARQEVIEIDRQHNEAMGSNDSAALDRIIADDCIFTNERGMIFGKAHRVDVTKSGKVVFSSYKVDDVEVRLYGNTAVVTERGITKGNDEAHTGQFRYTKVFVKRNRNWQLVAAQKGVITLPAAAAATNVGPGADLDAVKIDPKHYTIDLENDRVRVVRVRFGPHEKSPMHEHPSNSVGIYLTDFNARVSLGDGTSREVHAKSGGTIWRAPTVRHLSSENLSDQPMEALWIELKPSAAAASAPMPTTNTSITTTDSETAIRKIWADYEEAWNRHDAKALANFYAEDGDAVFPSGRKASGRTAVEAAETANHSSINRLSHTTRGIQVIRFITSDVALIDGSAEIVGMVGANGESLPVRQGLMTMMLVKRAGLWRIVANRAMVPVTATSGSANEDKKPANLQTDPVARQEILRLEEERRQAILHNDAAAMDRLLGEEFIVTDNEGRIHDRADELSLYKNKRRQTQSWEASDVKVRVHGDTAVVTERAAVKDVLDGKARDIEFRLTNVWVRRDGRWQVVARQGTPISQPPQLAVTVAHKNPSDEPSGQQNFDSESEVQARRVIDSFNAAGNKRDIEGLRNALNFPFVRIAGGKVGIARTREEFTGDTPPGALAEGWDHSTVDSVEFIQSSSDKVHAAIVFSRYKADGTRYATYQTLRIITKQDGHWGIQCTSSFAP